MPQRKREHQRRCPPDPRPRNALMPSARRHRFRMGRPTLISPHAASRSAVSHTTSGGGDVSRFEMCCLASLTSGRCFGRKKHKKTKKKKNPAERHETTKGRRLSRHRARCDLCHKTASLSSRLARAHESACCRRLSRHSYSNVLRYLRDAIKIK